MAAIIFAWVFGSFIYFKVIFDYSFHDNMTIMASLLMAITLGILVFYSSSLYAKKLWRYDTEKSTSRKSTLFEFFSSTCVTFLCSVCIFASISKAIIFGFAKDIQRDIEYASITLDIIYRNSMSQEFAIFLLCTLLPVLGHYILCLLSAAYSQNST